MPNSETNFNPLISVIIPVYNVEEYFHRCIDSVLDQEFYELEIILIDDGSPDCCPAICDTYSRKDHRIKVIHKINGGVSDARNAGIRAAQGDYLMFLDSDDYWEGSNCLRNLAERIAVNNADLTLYGALSIDYITNERQIIRTGYSIEELRSDQDTAIRSLFNTGQFPRTVWTLTVKKEFIIENQLYFKEGINAEDIDWLINVFFHASSFDAVNDTFYVYVINRPGALTTALDGKRVQDIMYSVRKWMPVLESHLNEVNRYLLSYLATQYIISLIYFAKHSAKNQKNLLPEIKQYKHILKYTKRGKATISRFLINIFGIQIGSLFLLSIYKTLNERQYLPSLKKSILR